MNKPKKRQLRNSLLVLFFLLPIISIGMSFISGITPVSPGNENWYSYDVVCISLSLNAILWFMFLALTISRFLYDRRVWALEYLTIVMLSPILLGILALNLIRPSLPDWRWLIVLAAMYPVVTVMPFINQGVSSFLHKELFAPKTKFGKALLWGLPTMGVTGATLSQMARNFGNGLIGFAAIGLIFHFLLVWQTASFAQQAWQQWQKEREKKMEAENA